MHVLIYLKRLRQFFFEACNITCKLLFYVFLMGIFKIYGYKGITEGGWTSFHF